MGLRTETTGMTTTADTVCADCAANTWAATGADACAAKTVCGKQVAVGAAAAADRTETTGMTKTADTVCAACAVGTFAVCNGDCTACTVVADSLTDTVLSCTSATDSRVVACAAAKRKTGGVDATTDAAGTADTCTTDCADGTFVASATACTRCTTDDNAATTATYKCTSAKNARFVGDCKDKFYKVSSGEKDVCEAHTACGIAVVGADALRVATAGTASADTVCAACAAGTYATGNGACFSCRTVTDSLAGTALTCTTTSDSRVVACAAKKVKHAGVDANTDGVTVTADTCADSVGCGNNIAGTARTATTPKTDTADAVCPACVTGASETAGNCGCDAGTFKNTDSTACTACTAAAAPDANAMYTCTDATAATAFTCKAGFFKDGDKCTACTAITNAGSITCTSATNSAVGMCNTGAEGNSDAGKCTACDAIANAAVTCTWPGNSQIATCNNKFELKSGACTAVATPAADAKAPAPAAADAPATVDAPSASLSAATSLVQSWSSIIVAAVMLVGIFQ